MERDHQYLKVLAGFSILLSEPNQGGTGVKPSPDTSIEILLPIQFPLESIDAVCTWNDAASASTVSSTFSFVYGIKPSTSKVIVGTNKTIIFGLYYIALGR